MCKRTSFTDSMDSFHIFKLELEFLFPTRFPRNEFVSVTKNRASLLTLYFCNADMVLVRTIQSHWLWRRQQSNPKRFRVRYSTLRYEAGSSVAVRPAGSTHLPCSRIKSFSRSTASTSGMLNFTAVLPT